MESDSVNPYESPKSDADDRVDERPAPSGPNHEKLVTLATFDNPYDAHLLRNELENNGIDATVANEASTSIFGATIVGPSRAFWIEVLVKESDAKAALLIKEQLLESSSSDKSDIPEWKCICGETVDAGFAVCWSCEAEYRG